MGSGNAWSRRLLLFLLVCGVLLASWHVIYESRRSPLDVAESRSVIEQPYQVVYEADFDHARLYLLKTADEYQTVWCSRDLFRWTSHMAQSTPFAGAEPILTVSSMSFSKEMPSASHSSLSWCPTRVSATSRQAQPRNGSDARLRTAVWCFSHGRPIRPSSRNCPLWRFPRPEKCSTGMRRVRREAPLGSLTTSSGTDQM